VRCRIRQVGLRSNISEWILGGNYVEDTEKSGNASAVAALNKFQGPEPATKGTESERVPGCQAARLPGCQLLLPAWPTVAAIRWLDARSWQGPRHQNVLCYWGYWCYLGPLAGPAIAIRATDTRLPQSLNHLTVSSAARLPSALTRSCKT
jgi:hypothetical protein